MADKKKLNEAPGLLGNIAGAAWNYAKNKRADAKDAKAHAYASSSEGQKAQNAVALNRWMKKLNADWAAYAHLHEEQPTLAALGEFFQHQYHINTSEIGFEQATTPVAAPVTPPPIPPQASAQPATAPAAAPAATVAPAPATPPAAPAAAPAPVPAAEPSKAIAPKTVAPKTVAPKPTSSESLEMTIKNAEDVLKNADATPEERLAARHALSAALRSGNVKANNGRVRESHDIDEDLIRDEVKHIDDLPSQIGDKTFRTKSLIDTMKELGLYDQDAKKAKKVTPGSTLTEDKNSALSPAELQAFLKKAALYILKDRYVLAASRRAEIGTRDYNTILTALKKKYPAAGKTGSSSTASQQKAVTTAAAPRQSSDPLRTPIGRKIVDDLANKGVEHRFADYLDQARRDPSAIDKMTVSSDDAQSFVLAMLKALT